MKSGRSPGRSLGWETVHHIDGDRQNNVIENLQFRFGADVVVGSAAPASKGYTLSVRHVRFSDGD